MLCKIPTFILSPFLSGQLSLILFTLKDGFFFFFLRKRKVCSQKQEETAATEMQTFQVFTGRVQVNSLPFKGLFA